MSDAGKISSTTCQILRGDCREILPSMVFAGAQFDAVVTDPPYGIGQWDWIQGSELVFHEQWGAAVYTALKPGAHAMVFAGTRTFPYVAYALTEAGFELRDTFLWLYGSGMPKSHNIKEGEYEGWGTGIKPAWEPILCFRKPLSEKNVRANLEKHGVGGFHVDATRIATNDNLNGGAYAKNPSERTGLLAEYGGVNSMRNGGARGDEPGARSGPSTARWPANVVIDEEAADAIDEQTGILKSGVGKAEDSGQAFMHNLPASAGGASRFYYCAKATRKERDAGLSAGENKHPTPKPIVLMRWLLRLVVPIGAHILDPFTGSGSTACAAVQEGIHFTGIEVKSAWVDLGERRAEHWRP